MFIVLHLINHPRHTPTSKLTYVYLRQSDLVLKYDCPLVTLCLFIHCLPVFKKILSLSCPFNKWLKGADTILGSVCLINDHVMLLLRRTLQNTEKPVLLQAGAFAALLAPSALLVPSPQLMMAVEEPVFDQHALVFIGNVCPCPN